MRIQNKCPYLFITFIFFIFFFFYLSYIGYEQRKTGGLSAFISPMMALYLYLFYLSYIGYEQRKTGGLSAFISPMMALYFYLFILICLSFIYWIRTKKNWWVECLHIPHDGLRSEISRGGHCKLPQFHFLLPRVFYKIFN